MSFCSFHSERALHFEDWNVAVVTKPYSEILSICAHLVIFAIKSFALNAMENLFLKIWSIFGIKTLSVEPCVHPSFSLHFCSSFSSECHLCFGSFLCHHFFVCVWLTSPFLVPMLLSLLCRLLGFFPWTYSGRCFAIIAIEITI